MGTKLVGPCVKEDSLEISSIPPGFESLVPFTMQKAEDNQVSSYSSSASAVESPPFMLETKADLRTTKPLRRRRGMKCSQLDNSSGDEYESDQPTISRDRLPKGLVRGCEACDNCQKVIAKWHPEEVRRPDLEAAPVFYPSEEEFEDTLKYISSIRARAEIYGICRIVPPHSWKPPSPLKEKNIWESSKFATRVQRIDKLQNRNSMKKTLQVIPNKKRKKRRCMKNGVDSQNSNEEVEIRGEVGIYETERFGFEPGPEFTLDAYQKYADYFKNQYFSKNNSSLDSGCNLEMPEQWQPSLEEIEGEYWRMVEKPTEEIEVLYGADIETGVFGSGFPKNSRQVHSASDIKYINSGWNLNNFPRLPGSVLSFESSDISGVLVPWLYVGMCFSSFCWHVEDHHLYSLNYMHWGAPKMWYGVPGSDAMKLEAAMRKYLPDLFEEQPDLLHKLVTQLSPSVLRSEGVPVFRCVQNPGEFVLTFPRAYHAGFNCGFNCAEAVNVAPVDWLPHGQNAIELYHEQCRKTTISHDKLLLGAAREAVKANWEYNLLRKFTSENLRWKDVCGKDGLLAKALKTRVDMERARRDFLCKSSQALKMESSFDANSERECSVCLFDLHLSAAGCHRCSPDKYACLNHAKQLCSCSWGAKFYLFRYDINELNILVEALEGKLSAVYRWARLDLGLALSSYVSKDHKQVPGVLNKLPYTSQGLAQKEASSLPTASFIKTQKGQTDGGIDNSAKHIGCPNSSQTLNPPIVVLALENAKASVNLSTQKIEVAKHKTPCKKEDTLEPVPLSVASCQLSQVDGLKILANGNLASKISEGNPSSSPGKNYVVLLSDDDENELNKGPSVEKEASEKHTRNFRKAVCSENMAGIGSCPGNPSMVASITDQPVLPVTNGSGPVHIKVEDHAEAERDMAGIGSRPGNPSMVASITDQPVLPVTNGSGPVHIKVEDHAEAERDIGVNPVSHAYLKTFADSTRGSPQKKESPCSADASGDTDNKPRHIDEEKLYEGDGQKNVELDADSRTMHNAQSVSCSLSGPQNILDRYYRQKGPRIAKVVRRINCNVEPLDFGTVCAGKLWCDSRAIYPKGFRSRVRYIDVVDPSNMCNYISEILDVGRDGPLFMVYVEHTPGEVFVHVSAARCWEMVRERVNQEIAKRHKLGRPNLPPLQPPGSLDGMEMFGFSSPAIVQAIQSMDQNRVCAEYWKSRPLMQIPQQSNCGSSKNNAPLKTEPPNDEGIWKRHQKILSSLFNKANSDELHTLYSLLYKKNSSDDLSLLKRLLNEEIDKKPR